MLGVYAGGGVEGRVYLRDARLFTQQGDEPERPVLAAAGDRFFYGPNSLTWFEAHRETGGAVVVELHPNSSDQVVRLTRTGPIPPPPVVARAVLERYVGRYELNGTIATIGLTADDRLTVQLTGQPLGPPLRTISASEFAGDSAGVRVRFEGDGDPEPLRRNRGQRHTLAGRRLARKLLPPSGSCYAAGPGGRDP